MTRDPIEILLVEDDPNDEILALVALSEHRLVNVIHVVRDGEEALEFLAGAGRHQGVSPPGVVLLDNSLPGTSGVEVLRHIRSDPARRDLPVVMLTSSHVERERIEREGLGVNRYIVKPLTFARFVDAMREIGMHWVLVSRPPG